MNPLDRMVAEGWRQDNVARCRSCKAEIVWMVSPVERRYPYNPDGTNHFSTCPQADYWRGTRK